ncbi:hypothetical protein CK203_108161 [Vitis vinifera]|uniref:Uncharacterized protein n=1 Tax=Vitis vinifera TaxID=29760 RepID=A0A438DJK5_VITVI|nr:hypothetical protein CK203_108161 [Vitis vinifera]
MNEVSTCGQGNSVTWCGDLETLIEVIQLREASHVMHDVLFRFLDGRCFNIAVGESSNIRKQRKRKTFAELKEEEELLLKERNHLQMLGTQSPPAKKAVAPSLAFKHVADQPHKQKAACDPSHPAPMVPTIVTGSGEYAVPHQYLPNGSSKVQAVVKKEPRFLLPDLNQPLEEDFSS